MFNKKSLHINVFSTVECFPEDADFPAIFEALSSYSVDTKHTLSLCFLNDVKKHLTDAVYEEPTEPCCFRRDKFCDWLADPLGREQFAYKCGTDSEVMWFDAIARQPEIVCKKHEVKKKIKIYKKIFFVLSYFLFCSLNQRFGLAFCWSPMGSYFLTIHKRGVWIRANNEFEKLKCFNHNGVKHVLFSPNEEYLITYDGNYASKTRIRNPAIIVWECCTGSQLAALLPPVFSPTGLRPDNGAPWPFFLFSPDSKYLAARRENGLTIYETATMEVLEETTSAKQAWFSYPLEQFQWSPADNLLSIWIPEYGDSPGRLLIVDVPSRQEVASKNVFSVKSVSMHWRECGEFLALNTVIVRRLHKKMKKEVTQIEIFRVKEKSIPVDIVDLEGFHVRSLHWEKGIAASRFATLTTDEGISSQKINFFEVPVRNAKQDTKLVQSLPIPATINTFAWSPAGQYFLAASKGGEGALIFGVLNEQNKAEIIQKDEHMDLTDVLWDPSGRYVTTAVLITPGSAIYRFGTHAGFRIYSFLGRLLYRYEGRECVQFLWRPRPPLMISRAKLDDVLKRLKEYSKRFDAQDEMRRQARQLALKEEGSEKMTKFLEFYNRGQQYLKTHPRAKEWEESWKRLNERLGWQEEVVTHEEIVEVIREKLKKPTN